MKKYFAIVLFAFMFTTQSFGQQVKHVIKLNPLAAIPASNITAADLISYEYVAGQHHSFGGGFVTNGAKLSVGNTSAEASRNGILAEFRYYTSSRKDAPEGFYLGVGPELNIWNVKATADNGFGDVASASATSVMANLSARVGWQWLLGKHVVLGVGGGVRIGTPAKFDLELKDSRGTVSKSSFEFSTGVQPSLNLTLGGAF